MLGDERASTGGDQKGDADDGKYADCERRVGHRHRMEQQAYAGDGTREGGERKVLFHASEYAPLGGAALISLKASREKLARV
jgi:hypothetical protein